MKKLIVLGAAAAMLSGVPAMAQALSASLAKMDKDKDGKLTLAEFAADRPALLKKLDSNNDGAITEAEARAVYLKGVDVADEKANARVAKVMAADADRDGKVTLAELNAAAQLDFKKRDRNGDGFIAGDDAR